MQPKLLLALLVSPALTAPTTTIPTSPAAGLSLPPLFDDYISPPKSLPVEPRTLVDEYLFSLSLEKFSRMRKAREPPSLDWSSDECSHAPNNPMGFKFGPSCQRHDFGYRNYKKQGRFTGDAKISIDQNFKQDLRNECRRHVVRRPACMITAEMYYRWAKRLGRMEVQARKNPTTEATISA